jgi:hypothetical protein
MPGRLVAELDSVNFNFTPHECLVANISSPHHPTVVVHNPDQDRARPLDHLIKPVANSLSLRLNVYESPSGATEEF